MTSREGCHPARVLAAVVAVVALTGMTACSGDSDDGSPGASASVAAPEGAFPGVVASGEPVKIGLINNEGGQSISQPENRETAEAAVEYANENLGGIGGRPIEVLNCKQGEEPASARDCANRMVEAKVSAVVVTSSGLGNLMAPIITGAGIPYVSANGTSSAENTSDNAFMWTGGFPAGIVAMADFASQQGMKNVSAFTIDTASALGSLQALGVPAFEAKGVTLKVIPIPMGTPDATPQVSAGLDNNPEGVMVIGESTTCTSIMKALGTLGSTAEVMTNQACVSPEVIESAGESTEGANIFTSADIASDEPETVLFKSVMAKYSPDTDISGYGFIGYQGMLGLIRATESVQRADTSAAAFISAIKATTDVPVPVGDGLTFSCDGTASPTMKAVCGKGSIALTTKDGKPSDPRVIGN